MGNLGNQTTSRLSDDGTFANGVSVVSLVRFIRAYDFEARIDDVADYFHLEVEDVVTALEFYSRNFDQLYPLVVADE